MMDAVCAMEKLNMSFMRYGHALLLRTCGGFCDMRIQKSQSLGRDFQSVFADLAERCSMEEIEICAVIARAIWTRRNAVVHGEAFRAFKCIAEEGSGKFKAVPIHADREQYGGRSTWD
jgi:hypothetical protein